MRDRTPLHEGTAHRAALVAAALACLLGSGRQVSAEPALVREFNGPQTTWELLETATPASILSQQCVPVGARDAAGSERIVTAAPAGESVMLHCPTKRIAVLPELQIRLWVKSDRPAVQLAARIALPRTIDPDTRAPATVIVRGAVSKQPGHWQQLTMTGIPKLLAAEVRVLRTMPGVTVDAREAFLDGVVLVVPGDPRGVEVVTDDLEVDGILLAKSEDVALASYPAVEPASPPANAPAKGWVRLLGGILLVDDRPFMPRGIEWRGEPFAFLAELGFNIAQLSRAPTKEQIAEARQHNLWFVCVPPRPESLARDGIGQSEDRVLAWYLDDAAFEADPGYALRWAELIRQHDPVAGRPVIVLPRGDRSSATRAADILLASHPLLSRMSPEDFDQRLAQFQRLARPGTPLWVALPTQLGAAARGQAAALSGRALLPPPIAPEQIDALVRSASLRGVRGFLFRSESSLGESDHATRRRAASLALLNRHLQRIEPWLASGKKIGHVESVDGAASGVVMYVDRARLLVPLQEPARLQNGGLPPATTPADAEIAFLIPGVSESSQAFVLSPVALRSVPAQRVAGGTRIVLPRGDTCAVLTEDPQVVQNLRRHVTREAARVVRLKRETIAYRAGLIAENARQLTEIGRPNEAADRGVATASEQLRKIDAQLAAGQLEQACELADAASRLLAQAAADQRRGLGPTSAFDSHPLAASDELLAEYATFQQAYDALRGGANLLYGGDFEDLGQLTHLGWRNFQSSHAAVRSHVELSATEPKHGRYCLGLHLEALDPHQESPLLEPAPLWVVSPPMPVEQGQIIAITGWVRIDRALEAGDGLQIVDSLGGPEFSLAIRQTSGWQPFQMLRAVPEPSELRLSFALAGLGSARIDAVMVRVLDQPIAHRLPSVAGPQSR